ncbi:hypothetical protein RRF57_009970 [Xylaria bambusicola]|uniref:Uncharacterized protein n=1 Tax=Xylaria bambusicola TaxID=326684 RepID=A0AAN7UXM1_9PEZI
MYLIWGAASRNLQWQQIYVSRACRLPDLPPFSNFRFFGRLPSVPWSVGAVKRKRKRDRRDMVAASGKEAQRTRKTANAFRSFAKLG